MPDALITGIHHVTAVAGRAARHKRFYTDTLGLRLVKRTVNFDDPFTWHLYYGDELGTPGTLLTHFPHGRAKPTRHGTAEIRETVMHVQRGQLDRWRAHLDSNGVVHATEQVFGVERLLLADPDDMRLALEEDATPASIGDGDPLLHGVGSVVVHSPDAAATIGFLTGVLGFEHADVDSDRTLLTLGSGRPGERIEIIDDTTSPRSVVTAGVVHHVAWRVPDDDAQAAVAATLRNAGIATTPVKDRHYFRSIYFRIPGGVIFEVATDGPGFDVDEPRESLGTALKLPPQFEWQRDAIDARLESLGD